MVFTEAACVLSKKVMLQRSITLIQGMEFISQSSFMLCKNVPTYMPISSPRAAQCHPAAYGEVLEVPQLGFIIQRRAAGVAPGGLCEP